MSDGVENDAYLDLVESEVGRAVAQQRVEGGLTELARMRTALSGLRVQARSTVRRTALTEGISLIDARMAELTREWGQLQ